MLIVPISRRPDWRKPPLVTLLLILVNVLVFFGLQSGDEERVREAYDYYADSILVKTELPRYVKHLEDARETRKAEQASRALSDGQWFPVLRMMESDAAFMERLRDGKIVQASEADYPAWRRQRSEFERLLRKTVTDRFAFKSAQPTLAGVIGHMFLHGDFLHLLGNMAFLFIVGYMVEEALGQWRYLLFYLLSGIGSCACYALTGGKRVVVPEHEIPADPRDGELAKVDTLLNALRLDEARRELRRLAGLYPGDLAIVNRYYRVSLPLPASEDYHRAAALIFALSDEHPASDELVCETFVEYLKLAKPTVRFTVRQLITLIRRLARTGRATDAERLTRVLARRSPRQKELPGLLLFVAETFRRRGDASMHDTMLNRLRQDFPDSEEARMARPVG
jgi:membrane associated rhomboid family serine protease